ncbi:MAG: hypothetical protein LBR80_14240 [Deltaproteobacteria bacterium]|jgi:hypothetical protein|nr:hypothetical protein [Deltaproteobacteria bacterium]
MAKDDFKNPDGSLDRQAYFRRIRGELMEKLGIPKGTKPERVLQMLQLQGELDRINSRKGRPQ